MNMFNTFAAILDNLFEFYLLHINLSLNLEIKLLFGRELLLLGIHW